MTTEEILREIRAKTQENSKFATTSPSGEADTNIKYSSIKEERRKKKERKKVSSGCPAVISLSETCSEPTSSLGGSSLNASLSSTAEVIARRDSLGTLRVSTTSCEAVASHEVVERSQPVKESSGPDIHYAKVTTRRPIKNTKRRKINFDYNVEGSTKMNKLTFATTDKFWEWERGLKADYASGALSKEDWEWYQRVGKEFEIMKKANPSTTIGKGCKRGVTHSMKKTACIYTISEAKVYIGDWEYIFELETISSGPASVHHDSMAEYRNERSAYEDLSWE